MKSTISYSILCGALLAALPYSAACAEDQPASKDKSDVLGRQEARLISITSKVEAIDLPNREVTLKGPLGNSETYVIDKSVKRLDEVKVGDLVTADYYISIAAELRKPTAEEAKNPLVVMEAGGKAPADAAPAAAGARRLKVVTTIEGLDRPSQTVTVKGPRGRYLTARVADPSRLTK